MPANLTPQYLEAEERYKKAKDNHERMEALKVMLSTIPKHKGTEKLQADIKRKIAKLRDDMEHGKGQGAKRRDILHVEREGAGQVAVIGPANVGKSQLVVSLTNATIEVADYPFTTRTFHPGMMIYENIQIQLVDLPPLSDVHMESWVPTVIRQADLVTLVVDLNRDDLPEQIDSSIAILETHKLKIVKVVDTALEDARDRFKRAVIIGNKIDLEKARENLDVLKELYETDLPIMPISAAKGTGLDDLKRTLFQMLEIVRVYSKRPGKEAEFAKPFIFKIGSNLLDFAAAVHQDFARNLDYARVWNSEKYTGQRINRDYVLNDGDVIELHMV